jgi:flagellar basal body P-ring formation protein FlgA
MEKPMGRCEGIVVSACQNISANRAAICRQFGAPALQPRPYSGRMLALAVRFVLLLGVAFAAFAPVRAAEPGPMVDAALDQQVRQLALQSVRSGTAGVSRVEITLGNLDSRLRLAPCQQVEPYLPNGVRLWGKARIGLRCTRGPSAWNVYLPITVKAWGGALVATAVLPAGSVLAATDLAQAEVDLAEDPSMALHDTPPVIGRTLLRALLPGQSLRLAHLKPRQWFAAGEQVQVLARGPGFSVAGAGEALTAGVEGQSARVRTEGGRVLVGLPVAENRMELPL